jgi:hypothetical protein
VELRLQHSNGQIVQRIKARAHNGKIFACQSHKLVLSDLQPNIDHARAFLPAIMRDAISLSALRPRFNTCFSRISHQFANAACTTLTSFDEGYIEAAGRSQLISEIEFELKAAGSVLTRKNASRSSTECRPLSSWRARPRAGTVSHQASCRAQSARPISSFHGTFRFQKRSCASFGTAFSIS